MLTSYILLYFDKEVNRLTIHKNTGIFINLKQGSLKGEAMRLNKQINAIFILLNFIICFLVLAVIASNSFMHKHGLGRAGEEVVLIVLDGLPEENGSYKDARCVVKVSLMVREGIDGGRHFKTQIKTCEKCFD